jgi:hypothetical protein
MDDAQSKMIDRRLGAIARAVTTLADGLSNADGRHTETEADIRGALVELIAGVESIRLQTDPGKMSVKELAARVPNRTICAVRTYQYQQGMADDEPAPLPPAPFPIDPDHTRPFALTHTDGRRRIMEFVGEGLWWTLKRGWPFILAALSAAITHVVHVVR